MQRRGKRCGPVEPLKLREPWLEVCHVSQPQCLQATNLTASYRLTQQCNERRSVHGTDLQGCCGAVAGHFRRLDNLPCNGRRSVVDSLRCSH